jgi:hypothetical protein
MRPRTLAPALLGAALAAFALAAPGARADDAFEPNDALANAHFLGGPLQVPPTAGVVLSAEGAVLEAGGAQDFYSFTAFANAPIAIRVEPLANGASDADERNLRLRLWRRVSAATNTFELLAQIDFNEAGLGEYHPPIPYTVAGFMVVEIDAPDGGDGEQPYRLRISGEALEPSIEPELLLANGLEVIADGGALSFGEVPLGERAGIALSVRNVGNAILRVDPPELSGAAASDYVVELSSGTIQPDGFAVLGIDFVPTAEGVREAELSLSSNDPAQPTLSFSVSGAGIDAAPPEPATLALQLALPGLSGLELAPAIEGVAVPIVLELAVDPSGRPVCAGTCSVAGEPVRVEAKPLKKRSQGPWVYRLKLFGTLSARFARLRGEIGSSVATLRLAGPEGDAKLAGVPVAESLDLDGTTRLRFFSQLAADGALSGSGVIESGLGNDTSAPPATLTGSVSETELAFVLKSQALRRRIAFRGTRQGDLFVGRLNYRIPPAKGKLLDQAVPADLFLAP